MKQSPSCNVLSLSGCPPVLCRNLRVINSHSNVILVVIAAALVEASDKVFRGVSPGVGSVGEVGIYVRFG